MAPIEHPVALANAAWRTWRAPGLARRAHYEVVRRAGRLQAAEQRWQATNPPPGAVLRPAGMTVPALATPGDPTLVGATEILLYGAVAVPVPMATGWHRHPLTGHPFDGAAHWSTMSDASAEAGDIKDIWEPARLGWLLPRLRLWASSNDDTVAEEIWAVVEDWQRSNPPYLGPNWMCGQETSLRTITVMLLADALSASPSTTDERRRAVGRLVHDAVGRVGPTLGYALSQRNNHAISEAGFLWSASVLAPWLPDAAGLRRRGARALTEAVTDQFDRDGSYSQHSPTYQRVALHVLLWCLAVSRATGEPAPDGVAEAVARSVPHLRSLLAPASDGRVPNLGGNDGALVFDLAPAGIDDLRPVLAHAAAATDQDSGLGPGPWDDEGAWFGLASSSSVPSSVGEPSPTYRPVVPSRSIHALTRGPAHAVLRAGPLSHRPAHADQLHVDIWLGGSPVAVDAGSYRYTAPAPWGNALADETVHNLPRVPGRPQAVRAGRFFWRTWEEAVVLDRHHDDHSSTVVARLTLPGGIVLRRAVTVSDGLVAVVDHAVGAAVAIRWNLMPDVTVDVGGDATTVLGDGWQARFQHTGAADVRIPEDDDPTSGWHAPHYGRREPLIALEYGSTPDVNAVAVFTAATGTAAVDVLGTVATALTDTRSDDAASLSTAVAVADAVASATN